MHLPSLPADSAQSAPPAAALKSARQGSAQPSAPSRSSGQTSAATVPGSRGISAAIERGTRGAALRSSFSPLTALPVKANGSSSIHSKPLHS